MKETREQEAREPLQKFARDETSPESGSPGGPGGSPERGMSERMLRLQRAIGNQGVGRLFGRFDSLPPGRELPHKATLERAFGVPLDGVKTYFGARGAVGSVGASAVAAGAHVAFGEQAPDLPRVAHEVTHVLQQDPARRSRGLAAVHGEPEREAARFATAVAAGRRVGLPAVAAPLGVVYRDVKSDLYDAMRGWGTDEEAIYLRLRNASPDEKRAVLVDPALMAELEDELTRSELGRVLGLLGGIVETRLRTATAGWGTDEAAIYSTVQNATADGLRGMMGNGLLLAELRDDLNDGELGKVLAIVANRLKQIFGGPAEEAYEILLRFPAIVTEALDEFDRISNTATLIQMLPIGHNMPPATADLVTLHINNDDNVTRGLVAFAHRWNITTGTHTEGGAAAPAWTVDQLRGIHRSMLTLPASHITRAGQNLAGIDLLGGTAGGHTTPGATPRIRIGERALGRTDTMGRGSGGPNATRTIDWQTRVVTHEMGHVVDAELSAVTLPFKRNAVNGWDWGYSADVWERNMTNPWRDDTGAVVPAAGQTAIKDALNNYMRNTDGTGPLRAGLPAGHALRTYWNKSVRMIEAAKRVAGKGEGFWQRPGQLASHADDDKYYSFDVGYEAFQCYKKIVHNRRVRDYMVRSHLDFFAVLYATYYEDGPGPNRGSRMPLASWKTFFDTSIHGAL